MPKHVGKELVLYRPRENPRPPTDSPDMRRGKRRVHIVDADGKAQGEISSAESSSQSTTNPAPNYRPSQSAAGGRPAAPRSSSHVRTSAGNMKGKAPSRYRTHRKPQRFGANRSDVSPDEGPSTRPYSTHSMPPQHTRSANPFMEGTRRSYDYEAPSKYSLQTRPQSMYSAVPELVPYVGYSSPYGPGSYTMPQHMAQYLYSQPPPPAPPPEEVAPPKTPAPPPERSPPPPPSQKRDEEGVEITNLRKQLELFKQEQKKREDLEKQKELEDKIRKDAEEKMAKIMEEMRLAQEQTMMEIEKARIEATMAARQAVEAERKAEEDRRRLEEEEAERCRRIAEEKIAAEVRAEAERVRHEKEEADRLSREMQAKVEQQQEERRRLQQQEKEDLERLRQEIIEQVRAEILERERRYLSSSSGSRSFSSRSSRSSNSYMSLSSTSEGGSNNSNSSKRRSRKSSLGRAAKVPSVKASSLKVAEAKTPASVLKEDASTSPPDPFVYLVGTSPPPPETEEDTQTQPYSSWEQTPYTMGWHYQPYVTPSGNQDSVYRNVSEIIGYQSQPWSLSPGDDDIGSSSSSETTNSDGHLSLGIQNMFQDDESVSGENSDTGTAIPASDPRRPPDTNGNYMGSGKNTNAENNLMGSGEVQLGPTVDTNAPKSGNFSLAIGIREGSASLRTPFKYLVTEDPTEGEVEQDDDNMDGGANLASQNSPQMTKKTAPGSANDENLTEIKDPVPAQRSPALPRSSSPNSPLLPLLAKHISDYEDEIVQRNKSRNSYYEPPVPLTMVDNWSYFPPYPASLTSGSNWPGDDLPKVVFPYYMGGHGRGRADDVRSRQMISTRSSSSVSSESEPEVPMALVPCIMIPLSMLQSSKQGPLLYLGGDPQ